MIETFFEKIIEELGATGLLVLGLYWILGKPLFKMCDSLKCINRELGEIRDCIMDEVEKEKRKKSTAPNQT